MSWTCSGHEMMHDRKCKMSWSCSGHEMMHDGYGYV
jgi:hypothetical protein